MYVYIYICIHMYILLCNGFVRTAYSLRQIRQITAVQTYSLSLVPKVVQCQSDDTKVRHSTPVIAAAM